MAAPTLTRQQAWLLATRPKTLPAAVAPVLVGVALALRAGTFRPLPALAALLGALLLQIGVNLANDYFDHVRGVDQPDRKGPVRVTQSGLIPPGQVRGAMLATLGAVALLGVYLIVAGGWPILIVGLASILAALAYSGGPFPLASHGLGDVFVFIFFGLVAVGGTYFVQARDLPSHVLAAAVGPGLLITAILVVNNLRDIDTDRRAGKRTLAVILGHDGSVIEFVLLLAGAYLSLLLMWLAGPFGPGALLPWLTLPMGLPLVRTLRTQAADGPAMNRALAGTARLALVFSLLEAVGLLLPFG